MKKINGMCPDLLEEKMKIKKAVVLAAGQGTRLLPATRSQPKEMLPVGRKPIIQYVLEEIRGVGISKILLVTGKMKRAIEDYFEKDKPAPFYIRQGEKRGTAGAFLPAEPFVENEPFVVAFGDSLIKNSSTPSLLKRMIEVHQKKKAAAVLAIEEVPLSETGKYGVVKIKSDEVVAKPKAVAISRSHSEALAEESLFSKKRETLHGVQGDTSCQLKAKSEEQNVFQIIDIIEKPKSGKSPGNLVLSARFIFEPIIFRMIHRTKTYQGELRITDSIRLLIKNGYPVYGVKLKPGEKRYDIGNFGSYYQSFIELALSDEEFGKPLKEYLQKLVKK